MYYMVFGKCNTNTQGLKIAKNTMNCKTSYLLKYFRSTKPPFFSLSRLATTTAIEDNGDAFLTPCLNSSCNCSSHDAQNKDIIYEICSMQLN